MTISKHSLKISLGIVVSLVLMITACSSATPVQLTPRSETNTPPQVNESPIPEQPHANEETDNGDQWELIDSFSGQTSQTTQTFHISGIKWRISWTLDTPNPEHATFTIFVYREEDGDISFAKITPSGDNQRSSSYVIDQGDGNYYVKIIASNLNKWQITIEDHNIKALTSPIQITHIHYKGRGYLETLLGNYNIAEADEFIEIKNTSDTPQRLTGWMIKNISRGIPAYIFPVSASRQYNYWLSKNITDGYPSFPPPGHTHYSSIKQMNQDFKEAESTKRPFSPFSPNTLAPYTSIRVYTGEYHVESGGFSFYYHPGDVWNNDEPDIAVLYNSKGEEVSRRTYTISSSK